jgi:serine/threonine protein kinase/predicted Zn-dependent protease
MIGRTISHYKIIEKIGSGGMGTVYKVRDTKLDRFVALKFLPLHLSQNEEGKKRFIQEAKAASALDHPNICTIYEIDKTENGQMFIAMACYDGEVLRAKIERGPLPLEQALDIAIQIVQGLAKAHAKGIIHRDIKPANILVTDDGIVKIIDFGLAKLAGRTMLTKEGTTMGTVAYMSPEQTKGAEVDHRTDIWSLGAVLYEIITGKQPFAGDYEQAVFYSIMNEDPEPITVLRTGMSMELERIVTKCLDKETNNRYQHADELIVDLRQLQGESKSRISASSHRPPAKKNRWSLGVASLAIAVLLAVILIAFFFTNRESEITERIPIAVVDFLNETNEPELDGLSGMLITSLEHSRRLSVLTRGRMFDILRQLQKAEIDHIDESLGKEICQKAGINVMAIASIRKFGERYSADLKLLDHQKNEYLVTAKSEAHGQENIPELIDNLAEETRKALKERENEIQAASRRTGAVTTINLEAYQHFFKGEELLNKLQEEESIGEFKKAIELDSTFGLAYYRLGYTLHFFGKNDEARIALSQANASLDRIPEKERYMARAYAAHLGHTPPELQAGLAILRDMEKYYPDDKELIFFIGDWSYHNLDFETAKKYLKRVLTMDPNFRRALIHLFLTHRDSGDYQGALRVAENMSRLSKDAFSYWMLGVAHGRLGQYESAVANLKEGLAISTDPDLYHDLVYVYCEADSLKQARSVVQETLSIDRNDVWSWYLLVKVLLKLNRPSEAEAFARQLHREHPGFHSNNFLAWILASGGIDADQAIPLAEKAMKNKPERFRDRVQARPYYLVPEHTLGLVYLQQHNYQKAVEFLEIAQPQAPLRDGIKNDLKKAKELLRQNAG